MAKLIRVLVYEGDPNWIDATMRHNAIQNVGFAWDVAGSADKEGGGGSITEVFRGTSEELINELKEKVFPEQPNLPGIG